MPQKNDNFSHFAKHRLVKKTLCCNPPLDPTSVVFDPPFFKKTLMLNKRPNLKSRKKTKIRKGNLKEKRREETHQNEKGLMKKNCIIE